LGNGADIFNAATAIPTFATGSQVFGENGEDRITANGFNSLVLDGGNGSDTIAASGEFIKILGGSGADQLTLDGRVGVVDGGSGADTITAINTFGNVFSSNTLTGGSGLDTFIIQNTNLFEVSNRGNSAIVDNADQILGGFDIITDFQRGETLDVPASALAPLPVPTTSSFGRMVLTDGQYATFRGDYLGTGTFRVDSANGHDLIVAWDTANGVDGNFLDQGAVVLLGLTDASGIVFA